MLVICVWKFNQLLRRRKHKKIEDEIMSRQHGKNLFPKPEEIQNKFSPDLQV
jgi:hypothetical protein